MDRVALPLPLPFFFQLSDASLSKSTGLTSLSLDDEPSEINESSSVSPSSSMKESSLPL